MSKPPEVTGILETVLYYAPGQGPVMERFYLELMGFRRIGGGSEGGHPFLFLRTGGSVLLLFDREASLSKQSPPHHGAAGPGHVCFLVPEADYEEWKTHLRTRDIPIEEEASWPRGGRSFYFRDPAGNTLEMANRDFWPE